MKQKLRSKRKLASPKSILRLPDLEAAKSAVLNGLSPGTINLRRGAVRRLAYEAADRGLLSTDLAAGIRRVKGVKKLGVRLGNWLTADPGQALWQSTRSRTDQGQTRSRVTRRTARLRTPPPRRNSSGANTV
jgi:hypothetical protein